MASKEWLRLADFDTNLWTNFDSLRNGGVISAKCMVGNTRASFHCSCSPHVSFGMTEMKKFLEI
jgi:hypothetical protein